MVEDLPGYRVLQRSTVCLLLRGPRNPVEDNSLTFLIDTDQLGSAPGALMCLGQFSLEKWIHLRPFIIGTPTEIIHSTVLAFDCTSN